MLINQRGRHWGNTTSRYGHDMVLPAHRTDVGVHDPECGTMMLVGERVVDVGRLICPVADEASSSSRAASVVENGFGFACGAAVSRYLVGVDE
ncbi:hypothetical protein [Mycobacterium sp. UM_Kg27]|uniref:hypothetical protein n=1 Tax=Mycobacterium sp. UM_Kg27 TaxID=1545693 RepID=UPI00061AE4CD|nr:hypothetical protein [Mycobacterium sp. UM_Kg27]